MPVEHIRDFRDLQERLNAANQKLVVLDFYADWCGPCKFIAPVFEQLSNRYSNAVFCKVNVDHCRDVMQNYGIRAMPTFLFLKNGNEVDRLQGANRDRLEQLIDQHYSTPTAPPNPSAATEDERRFLDQFVRQTKRAALYDDLVYKTLALSLIPSEKLTEDATVEGKVNRFLLAKNLTEWFKGEFFSWVDTPKCGSCGETALKNTCSSGTPTPEEQSSDASRVEVYNCACGQKVRFPRYNDPAKLLETRSGRCGEWANCFTLCAAAMEFDVRFIYDVTDHVWTELWIPELDRWVHVDPCENMIDAPLVYEKGWGKSLSYVLAFGLDHVYDVTWRYSLDYSKTMKLRTSVREPVLLNFITKLNVRLSKDVDPARLSELSRRRLPELVEFLHIGKRGEGKDYGGRISGDEQWKKSRSEAGPVSGSPKKKQIVLRPNDKELAAKKFVLSYDSVRDVYSRGDVETKGFQNLVFKSRDVQWKKELDWKMVYLCRKEGKKEGEISWAVDLTGFKAKRASLKVKGATEFHAGRIQLLVCADDLCAKVPKSGEMVMDEPPSSVLYFKALLSGDSEDSGFQHTQLFRSPLDQPGPHLLIEIELE